MTESQPVTEGVERGSHELAEHPEQPVPVAALDGAEQPYPSDLRYWWVALFLAVATAIEVSTYSSPSFWTDFPLLGDILIPSLLLLMAVKFFTVTWWFMHLKFDSRLLTSVFYIGLALALAVYVVTLITFQFFD